MNTIPSAALNQHIAILGKTGSGKSYAARGVVEHLLTEDRQVCILDPTSAWWGLRLASNGKDKGYDVVLLGGERADIPLHERSGAAVARLVTEQGASVVIDTGGMTVGEYTRWFIDFAGTLYTTVKSPLHLVIDEAHHFMPQGKSPDVDAGRMLHAGNRLMSGGRSRGIRGMLITQRPAKLHKDSLTCADTLVAMRMIAPQDRAAVKDWIDGAGDPARGRDVLDSLASLERGEGWVWYPEGKHLERVRFPKIKTYDSSATPSDGGKSAPKVGEIKLDEVRAAMAEAVRDAEANDPKALRAKVAELTKRLADAEKARASAAKAVPDPDQIEAIRHQARIDAAQGLASIIAGRANLIRDMGIDIAATVKEKFAEHERFLREVVSNTVKAVEANRPTTRTPPSSPTPAKRTAPATPVPIDGLTKAQVRIMESLAWLVSIGIERPSAKAVGLLSRIDPTGGYFSNTIGPLCSQGLVERSSGEVRLTDAGRASVESPASVTLADYHARVRETLTQCRTGKTAEMFDALVANGPGEMTAEDLGRAVGVDHTGGYFSNNVGPLATLGLIERSRGQIRTTDIMFPEGLA